MAISGMRLVKLILLSFFWINTYGQEMFIPSGESCTSIMAGRKATTDGSVITSHTCDGKYRTWLNIIPATILTRDTMQEIAWGTMLTETPWDTRGVEVKGKILKTARCFAYLNTAYPCMNEKQVGIGESTISGKQELQNKKGLFMIENLEMIVLQRCTTARQAIRLMGELVKEYGYADAGECLTIADKKEVWVFEIFGEGPEKIGGVWAAQRIPDDHVGVCANISRISTLDLKNSDYFMASDNVFEVAQRMKFWDGKEPFRFWKAYSGEKPFQVREFFILSSLAPSLNLDINAEELPFSVKPDAKISVRDVMRLLRSTFEGTPYDMTKNIKQVRHYKNIEGKSVVDTIVSPYANPWMRSEMLATYNNLDSSAVKFQRTCAVAWCAYSFVIQLRDWLPDEVGGVAWFSFDNPAESPRFPIFCGALSLPQSFNYSGQFNFNENSAHWQYRQANRLATIRWGDGRKIVEPAVLNLEEQIFTELPRIESRFAELLKEDQQNGGKSQKAREYLTRITFDYYRISSQKWLEIRDQFWTTLKLSF